VRAGRVARLSPSRGQISAWTAALAVAALAAPLAGQESQRPLDPGHWSYAWAELLQGLGCPGAWTGWSEPLVASSQEARLDPGRCEALSADGTAASSLWLSVLRAELGEDYDGNRRAGVVGLGVGAERGAARFEAPEGFMGGARLEWRPLDPVTFWAQGRGTTDHNYQGLTGGGLAWRAGDLQVLAGRLPMSLGQGTTRRLLNGRRHFDGVSLGMARPARLPWIFRYLGPLSFQLSYSPSIETEDGLHGMFLSGMLAVSPHPRIQIGAKRTDRFGSDDIVPFNWEDFWNMLWGGGGDSDFDDSQGSFDLRLRIPLPGSPELTAYGTLAFEDLDGVTEDPGLLVGGLIPVPMGSGVGSIRYEWEAFGRRAMWCPGCTYESHSWYVHKSDWGRYSANGTFLGSELGGYGAAHRVELQYFSGMADRMPFWIRLQGFAEYREVGEDRFSDNTLSGRWPGDRYGGRLEFSVRPRSAFELRSDLMLSTVSDGTEYFAGFYIQVFDLIGFPGY
jgi:hypothetical protein